MHGELAWVASTPAGQALGERAAREIRVATEGTPWWSAPLEPLRWLNVVVGSVPHTFYTMAILAVLSLLFGLAWLRRGHRPAVAAAAALALMLTLGGMFHALRTFDTYLSGGLYWRVPAGAPYRLANLHAHSQASGGALMPEDLVDWHLARGFTVLAITDSNGLRAVPRAQAHIDRNRLPMVLVGGEEYRGTTHLLMFNISRPVLPAERGVPQAIADARAQGGTVVVAHPWTSDRTPAELVSWGASGFEITNGGVLADEATRDLATRDRLAVVGDLDFRTGQHPLCATVLPSWADSPAAVARALLTGECAALYFDGEVDVGTFSYVAQLRRNLAALLDERVGRLLAGLAFWGVLAVLLRGRFAPPSGRLPDAHVLLVVAACAVVTAAVAAWCMWWQLRRGWLPRTEWAFYVWALCTPLAWASLRRATVPSEEAAEAAPNRRGDDTLGL